MNYQLPRWNPEKEVFEFSRIQRRPLPQKSKRETIISQDDIMNLKIELNREQSFEKFLERI